MHVHGLENIPNNEGALLAANHRTRKDVFLFPAAVVPRPVTMVSKYEQLEAPVIGSYLRKLGAIPVHRGGPTPEEFREMVNVPKSGRLEASYPEGTRDKKRKKAKEHVDMGKLETGFARIARRAGVLTIPTALYGMDELFSNYRVVAFGEPMPHAEAKEDEADWTDELRGRISSLYLAAHNREIEVVKIRW